jgi:bifunctional non-homologous end joining protein LigD
MVMKRYPNGAYGDFFFMKRAPSTRPDWLRTCRIPHPAAVAHRLPCDARSPLVALGGQSGCIDLNPWYARCDDVDRPDYLHFDLDPTPRRRSTGDRDRVARARGLEGLGMSCYAKDDRLARHPRICADPPGS